MKPMYITKEFWVKHWICGKKEVWMHCQRQFNSYYCKTNNSLTTVTKILKKTNENVASSRNSFFFFSLS